MPLRRSRLYALAGSVLMFCMIAFPPAHAAGKHTNPEPVDRPQPLVAVDRFVLMVGEGSVTAMPDTAIVSGGVITKARTAGDALHDNNEAMAKVIAALKALGITDKQITTASIQFRPLYPPFDPKTGQSTKVIGYQVSNSLRVTLTDLDRAGDVLDALIENDANESATINFEIKNQSALEEKARAEAAKDALKRAQVYAREVGAELGNVRSIREGRYSDSGGEFPALTMPEEASSPAIAVNTDSPSPAPPPGIIVQASEQTISATVTVVWALK